MMSGPLVGHSSMLASLPDLWRHAVARLRTMAASGCDDAKMRRNTYQRFVTGSLHGLQVGLAMLMWTHAQPNDTQADLENAWRYAHTACDFLAGARDLSAARTVHDASPPQFLNARLKNAWRHAHPCFRHPCRCSMQLNCFTDQPSIVQALQRAGHTASDLL